MALGLKTARAARGERAPSDGCRPADDERCARLDGLIARHERAQDEEEATRLRREFLLALEGAPNLLAEERFARFLEEHVVTGDFAGLHWKTPHDVAAFCETLYRTPFESEEVGRRVTAHVNGLLMQALHQFEREGAMEDVFRLLQLASVSLDTSEANALRLRRRAAIYERRRARRRRRWLYGYVALQAVLITLVFPLLFINAENGKIQQRIEEMTKVEMEEEEPPQYLSYADGLYWSLITAGSIGYGDITPRTGLGRIIAATLGVMGVITIGVVAGLILNWVTPRRLE